MIKILFVCTGNICRSPIAEGILCEKLKENNIAGEVDSCGFESFHVGDQPDPRALAVAAKRGIDLSRHRARLFGQMDFDRFDLIYAMDSSHFKQIIRLSRSESDRARVDYILNMLYPGENRGVTDPWYYGTEAFENVYLQLEEACDRIIEKIIAEAAEK